MSQRSAIRILNSNLRSLFTHSFLIPHPSFLNLLVRRIDLILRSTLLRWVLTLLLGLALIGLTACDSSPAPSATPIPTPGGGATPAASDQAPAPVGTQGGAPAAVPTGGAPPAAVPSASLGPLDTPTPDPNEPPRITVEELQKLMDANSVLLIDVRSKLIYEQTHIQGAVSAPFEEIEQQAKILPKDRLVVAYCQ